MQGVILGYQKTDFGITKFFEEAKKIYVENPSKAVSEGITNEDGEPLYQNGFNKGEVIDLSTVQNKICFGIAKRTEKGKETQKFEKMSFRLGGEKAQMNIPLFAIINFKAIDKRDGNKWDLRASANTENIEIVKELDDAQVDDLVTEYYNDSKVDFKNVAQWHNDRQNDYNRIAVIKGNVQYVNKTQGDKSNVLTLNEPVDIMGMETVNFEEMKTMTCWMDKEMDINFSESAQNLLVIGRTGLRQDTGEINMQVYGIYCPSKFRKPSNMKEVRPDEPKNISSDDDKPEHIGGWIK